MRTSSNSKAISFLLIGLVLLSFSIFSCGKSGGGDDGSSGNPFQVSSPNPSNGAIDVLITQQLSWAAATGATSYAVFFDLTTTGWTSVTNTALTAYNPGSLAYGTTYYWRIDSKNSNGTTLGIVWSFETQVLVTPPAQVTTPTPADSSTNIPITSTLNWAAASGATSYDVYFELTTTAWTSVTNTTLTSYNPGTLAYGTIYYWRIDSKNSAGTTSGNIWSFQTLTPNIGSVAFIAHPQNTIAGQAMTPISVEVRDTSTNVLPGISVTITSTDQLDVFGTVIVNTDTNGIATFDAISMTAAGSGYMLKAIAGVVQSLSSNTFDVSHAPLSQYLVYSDVTKLINNAPGTGLIYAIDNFGNLIDDDFSTVITATATLVNTQSVTFYTDDTYQFSTVTYTLGDIGGGMASIYFKAIHDGLGNVNTMTVNANDSLNNSGVSDSIIVERFGPAAQLQFLVQPSDTFSGSEFYPPIEIIVLDTYNNVVVTATDTVILSVDSVEAELVGTTSITADGFTGVARFDGLIINGAQQAGYRLVAASGVLIQATSDVFAITGAGPAAKLGFIVQPITASAGVPFAPVIQVAVQDASGNLVNAADNLITITINQGGSLLGYDSIPAVNGIAYFDGLAAAGLAGSGYILTATAVDLQTAQSDPFVLTFGAPSILTFISQPTDTVVDTAFNPVVIVAVQDDYGNTVITATDEIILAVNVGATLGGTTNVTVSDGIATFTGVTVSGTVATGYRLTANALGFVEAQSNEFAITN